MTRNMLLAASILILLSGAVIAAGEEEAVDPVCGMTVSPKSAAASAAFDEKLYYFCSVGCYEKFVADPKAYLAGLDIGARHHSHEEFDDSTLEGSMEKLQVLMLEAVEGVLHGTPDRVREASAELVATSETLKKFSKDYAGIKWPAFDAYAIELGKTATALEASLEGGTEKTFNSLSTTLSACVSCHMTFRDVRTRDEEHHY